MFQALFEAAGRVLAACDRIECEVDALRATSFDPGLQEICEAVAVVRAAEIEALGLVAQALNERSESDA